MMNLTTDPWIPVVDASGASSLASLQDVFAGGHRDLAVRPHERVALMRLLLCVAHAALDGPKDRAAWKASQQELPGKAKIYLDDHRDEFDLFHPTKPFLQFAGLEKQPKPAKPAKKGKAVAEVPEEEADEGTSASKLDFALSTGNNTTLFDHGAANDEPRGFTPAQLALMLITFQCFSPGGRIGVARWKGANTPGNGASGHAPCAPSAMLHSFIRAGSLIDTIHANLISRHAVAMIYGKALGQPVWERMPGSFSDEAPVQNATGTFLGRLAPLTRALLLRPDGRGLVLANGHDYPTFPEWPHEPTAAVVKKRDDSGHALVGAGTKAIWRELPGLVMRRKAGEPGGPITLTEIAEAGSSQSLDIWVGALITDKASILDTVEGVHQLPAGMLKDEGRLAYEAGVRCSEEEAGHLSEASRYYRKLLELKPQGCPEATFALRRYWTDIELIVPLLNAVVASLGNDDGPKHRAAWEKAVRLASSNALDAACPHQTPRQQRAHALARRALLAARQRPKESQPTATKS